MVRTVIVIITSVVLFALVVSCLLTKDFSAPGTLKPSDLIELIDWELTGGQSGEQTEEATVTIVPLDGEEVICVEGLKDVWFDLTGYIALTPKAIVEVLIEVKSTEKVTMYFHAALGRGAVFYSTNEEVETTWKEVWVRFEIPENLPQEPRLLFRIEINEDAVFYIRNLRVLPASPASGGEVQ